MRIVNHLPPSGETINLVRPAEIKKKGSTEAETVSRMVEHTDMKDAAPQLFQVENEIARMCLSLCASNGYGFSKLRDLTRTAGGQISVELLRLRFRYD